MVNTAQRRAIYGIMSLTTLLGVAYFFFVLFLCGTPVLPDLYWQRMILSQCISHDSVLGISYTHAAVTTATDLCLAIIPIPMIIKSKIRKDEKWVVMGIFIIATL
jgi:hypothetical protein